MNRCKPNARGFTMLEMMVAMAIFLVICGAMFELLQLSQKKYSSETQLTAAYQDAHLALDQIVRDVSVAGYPPANIYTGPAPAPPDKFALSPVAWSPNYAPGTAGCAIGTCTAPGAYDLILETRLAGDARISWIWYHLNPANFTLYREVVPKASGDPWAAVSGATTMTPLLENVMNNPGNQLAQIVANYPSMFPSGQTQPIFLYACQTSQGAVPCGQAAGGNRADYITDIDVTLIVSTMHADIQTGALRLVELSGRGHIVNPVTQ